MHDSYGQNRPVCHQQQLRRCPIPGLVNLPRNIFALIHKFITPGGAAQSYSSYSTRTVWRMRRFTCLKPLPCSITILAFGFVIWLLKLLYELAGTGTVQQYTLMFDIPPSDPVGMTIHNTQLYGLTPRGAQDYAALLPSGGHVVHLGSPPKAYTPTLFHQLKCLGIIHAGLMDVPDTDGVATPTPLISHCLNYLRQTILCRPNLRLESVINANASSEKRYETVCRNWEAVYMAVEQNQKTLALRE